MSSEAFINFTECFIEIHCEKMPIYEMRSVPNKLLALINEWLTNYQNTSSCTTKIAMTPYRLCICINRMPLELVRHSRKIKGPTIDAPTDILHKFAAKFDKTIEDLFQIDGYWFITENLGAEKIKDAISSLVEHILSDLDVSDRMSWGPEITWVRPVRRIVCIFDRSPLLFSIDKLNIKTSMESLFFIDGSDTFCADSYKSYLDWLRSKEIIVEREARIAFFLAKVNSLLADGECLNSKDLHFSAELVADRFESIFPYKCYYSENFNLPKRIKQYIIINEEKHLPIETEGESAVFAYANHALCDGGECFAADVSMALYNRLQEIHFHWSNSISKSPEEYVEMLKSYPLGHGIGTLYDQYLRLCSYLNSGSDAVKAAALYINFDLLMDISTQNPSLYGTASAEYVKIKGICTKGNIENILLQSVLPEADEDVPAEMISDAALLSLYRRLDSLIGLIRMKGEVPKGSSDPLGLRRQAFAILKLGFHIKSLPKISVLIKQIMNLYELNEISFPNDFYENLIEFFREKAMILMSKINKTYGEYFILQDINWQECNLLNDFLKSDYEDLFSQIKTTIKRIRGILKSDIGNGGEQTYIKHFNPLMDFIGKDIALSASYISNLCNHVNNALNDNKPIKELTKEKISQVLDSLDKVKCRLEEYCWTPD